MHKVTQGRIFDTSSYEEVLCLSFTADNRYLLSSHRGGLLLIWNVVEGELYKEYILNSDMVAHRFTPDNQFLLSLFKNSQELSIWNNYIGKLSSTREP
jgi:WD40 repeat protein